MQLAPPPKPASSNAHEYKYWCEPNGGCKPGTVALKNGWCVVQDPSKFALDSSGNAKIELTLSAFNTGSMNYQKIDASEWGGIIVAGDSAKGFPFPTLKATNKTTNKVGVTVLLSQGRLSKALKEEEPLPRRVIAGKVEERDQKFVNFERRVERAWQAYQRTKQRISPHYRRYDDDEPEEGRLDRYTSQALAQLERGADEYKEKCTAGKADFLALRNYIDKIVTEQESQVYKGGPDMSLDSIVLTSEFQISFDATAGTRYIFRILPVLVPPVLGLNPDRTHSLKLTFAGAKSRVLASNPKSLLQRCLDRLRYVADAAEQCRRPQAIYLESLIEAVESIKSTGAN